METVEMQVVLLLTFFMVFAVIAIITVELTAVRQTLSTLIYDVEKNKIILEKEKEVLKEEKDRAFKDGWIECEARYRVGQFEIKKAS